MKKRLLIISFTILISITIINVCINNKKFNYNGALLALTIDGKRTNVIPTEGLYKANIKCENGKGKWLQKEDGSGYHFVVEDITGDVTCNVELISKKEEDLLINKIQEIKEKTNNNGICTNESYTTKDTCESNNEIWWGVFSENGLRYEGKSPDNYISFNNELWRIIGYLPVKDKDGNDTNLVKIIRKSSIGGLSISNLSSAFLDSSLYNILNSYYYNSLDGTYSGYCFTSSKSPTTCDYSGRGLKQNFRNMIKTVQLAIGLQGSLSTVETHYNSEVSSYTSLTNGISVGLMNTSDYGYSVMSSDCVRTTSLGSYNTDSCAGKSWLYGYGYEWLLSSYSSNNFYRINYTGNISNTSYSSGHTVRPTLYLDPSVYVISGTGTELDPYIIGI